MRRAAVRAKRLQRRARTTRSLVRMTCADCLRTLVQRDESVRDCPECAYSMSESVSGWGPLEHFEQASASA
jgi:hypothetical protein